MAFNDNECEAVLLVDASNAFNSLNRQVALRNIRVICPSVATALINTYRRDAELFVDGSTLYSQEGTTQGDPLAMPMYALALCPLIEKIKLDTSVIQLWYADDATAAGRVEHCVTGGMPLSHLGPNLDTMSIHRRHILLLRTTTVQQLHLSSVTLRSRSLLKRNHTSGLLWALLHPSLSFT